MKTIFKTIIAFILLISAFSCSYADNPYNYKIKDLYSEASGISNVIYQIPIDVRLLDISSDANWYKVMIKFNLGPAEFKHIGWAYVPIGKYLAERGAASQKTKSATPERQ